MTLCPPWLIDQGQQVLGRHAKGALPHALLITGIKGIGKRDFANWLIEALLCHRADVSGACGECPSCLQLKSDGHPDFVQLQPEGAAEMIKVDAIRELLVWMQLTAAANRYRIALLERAERMNRNSANSLLKTLEEPSERAVLVLVSDLAGALPATIRSRCQTLTLRLHDRESASSWLNEQLGTQSPSEGRGQGQFQALLERGQIGPYAILTAASEERRATFLVLSKAWQDLFLHRASIGKIVDSLSEIETRDSLEAFASWCSSAIRLKSGVPAGLEPALQSTVESTAPCLSTEQWFTVRTRILHLHRIDGASFRTTTVLEGLLADMRNMISG